MFFTALALHLVLQGTSAQPQDSTRTAVIKRKTVTDLLAASAFESDAARTLLTRARRTRMEQDSALKSYDAKVRQRLSVSSSIGKFGREHLVYRQESASRVQWQRGIGAHVEMTGARVAVPIAGSKDVDRDAVKSIVADVEASPIPYFPGSETLWIGGLSASAEIDEKHMINPLASGAEAYYTYRAGDSATFRLPNGSAVRLRELAVRPRAARVNLVVGSLWFDTESGQLVRAVYRLSAPGGAGVSVNNPDDSTAKAPKLASMIITGLLSPNKAEISSITIEYGLYGGRFWLPRNQAMEGSVTAMFLRVPVRFEDTFEYASVNGPMALTPIAVDTSLTDGSPRLGRPPRGLDATAREHWLDSARVVYQARLKAREDSVKAGMQLGTLRQCDTGPTRVITQYRYDAKIPVEVRIPCNIDVLTTSDDLPGSVYDANDEVFSTSDRDALVAGALGLATQAPFSLVNLPPVRLQFGPSLTRYNRIEGFSTGLGAEQQLGGGYSIAALGRYGFGDASFNGDLSVARSNATHTVRLGVYKRLMASNDWGNPLSFGSSLSALFFARDDGFYYRSKGAELQWTNERGPRAEWRLFTEREDNAVPTRTHTIGGNFGPNIVSPSITETGASLRFLKDFGLDPHGAQAFADLRLESAGGDSTYGRAALDLTLSHGIGGNMAAALTVGGGTSVGGLPLQRHWFLGGVHTIRGQSPSIASSGNAFWFTRGELGRSYDGYKLALFGDIGWTGDRSKLSYVGRPLSGTGIGMSMFDGLLRADIARGLYPAKQTLLYLYLDARF